MRDAAWNRLRENAKDAGRAELTMTMVSFLILRPSLQDWGDDPAEQIRTGQAYFVPHSYGCGWTTFDMSWDRWLFSNAKPFRVAELAGAAASYRETDVVVMQPLGDVPRVALISCGPPLVLRGVTFEHLIIDWDSRFRRVDNKINP